MKQPKISKAIMALLLALANRAHATEIRIGDNEYKLKNVRPEVMNYFLQTGIVTQSSYGNYLTINYEKLTKIEFTQDAEVDDFVKNLKKIVGDNSVVRKVHVNGMVLSSQDGGYAE
jgi:hypothetical protein